ncbi:hypothetical protein BGW36DRAFT_456599 [Talaromyces proteolyticus]|uniref:Uncharacterized protein n=1 Tax=Talaromyces proteolyticus TaxID=1131652 RepID=A0AAD4L0Y0_9EURO|nr:uncharacterized protein BGW36DRAFT_456599 [Talaromyces proteolyticus]KAH8705074.1 hypothetical protein BGW36DRAFT_456599 [Talaromyces proteolyticus]
MDSTDPISRSNSSERRCRSSPEPVMPTEFSIHLYNPDQIITVQYKPKTWNTQPSWEFEMPQQSFKQPSNSTLDQMESDPAASDITPKLKFVWRKDGSLSKDFACYLSGKTTTPGTRKKNKEPDITLSIFKALKELTLYEPNLYRVEMEDFKGLEVVLMLGAVVIRDIFFGPLKDAFNIANSSAPVNPVATGAVVPPSNKTSATTAPPRRPQVTIPVRESRPALAQQNTNPSTNRETDAENARMKQQRQAEEQQRRRRAEAEERQSRELLEAEKKRQQKKQADINKETERLKKLYGKEDEQSRRQKRPPQPPRSHTPGIVVHTSSPVHQARYSHYLPPTQNQQRPGPYMQSPGKHRPSQSTASFHAPPQPPRPQSSASFFGNGQRPPSSAQPVPQLKEKKSFFGFLRPSDNDDKSKLSKKRSSMF